jgi:hypothetical protein
MMLHPGKTERFQNLGEEALRFAAPVAGRIMAVLPRRPNAVIVMQRGVRDIPSDQNRSLCRLSALYRNRSLRMSKQGIGSMEVNCEFGTELQQMLNGKKPMAVFYRGVQERFDETGGQPFGKYVASGKMNRTVFYEWRTNNIGSYRVIYIVYTILGEEWRADMYRALRRVLRTTWNEDLEHIEAKLLGYGGFSGKPITDC